MTHSNKPTLIITGASSGIGRATALLALKEGYTVYNLDYRKPEEDSPLLHFIECDVREKKVVTQAIQSIIQTEKNIVGLFANAGIYEAAVLELTEETVLDDLINTNIKGVFFALQAILPYFKLQQKGSIVITASDQGLLPKSECSAYGLTKGALIQLTKAAALEYAKANIRINAICPGTIEKTHIHDKAVMQYSRSHDISLKTTEALFTKEIPISRAGTPQEVAELALFLLSDKSSFITGSIISVDGGEVLK
jgi:2-keto-3-deoxy-L-fuconate dehydrogenase